MKSFSDASVEAAYLSLPHAHQVAALQLREWIHEVASELDATGGLEEALKWGQPGYLPIKPRVGSTVRVWRHDDQHVGLYFNCQSMLVENFRALFADDLLYSKNRAVLFDVSQPLPEALAKQCMHMALYYHRDNRSRTAS